jgi:hypothetical protein
MLIQPEDVTGYTAFDVVKNREPEKLTFDIVQAQQDIFQYCGHKFTDAKYSTLPDEVKLAFIKVTEYYALINSDESIVKGIKSEKIGDYQYQIGEGRAQTISLSNMLYEHVLQAGKSGTRFRMRSI